MAFVHPQSCECVKSELDLFSVPPTQTSIESGSWVEYNPISSITHGTPIEFVVGGSGQDYINLANTQLLVCAKIIRQNDGNIDNTHHVGPVNLLLHSLFSEVDLKINDTLVTSTNNTYVPYSERLSNVVLCTLKVCKSSRNEASYSGLTNTFITVNDVYPNIVLDSRLITT